MDRPPWEGMGGYTEIDSATLPMLAAPTPTIMGVPLAPDAAAVAAAPRGGAPALEGAPRP